MNKVFYIAAIGMFIITLHYAQETPGVLLVAMAAIVLGYFEHKRGKK